MTRPPLPPAARATAAAAPESVAAAPAPLVLWGILVVAVLLMATSSPLVLQARAAGMGVLMISFWRMAMGALLQAPLAALPGERGDGRGGGLGRLARDRRAAGATLVAGALLGLHFAAFIGALAHTTVASATTLTATVPVFTALLARAVLGERTPRAFWPSLAIAFAGVVVMTSDQWGRGTPTRSGNLLALGAAVTAAGYLVAGRRARARLAIGVYVTAIYAVAAAVLGIALAAGGGFAAPSWPWGWTWIAALAVFPTTLGHSLLSWSLRWVSPAVVSLLALAEPPLAMLLCFAWLGQPVTLAGVAGMALTLAGLAVLVAASGGGRRRRLAPPLEEPPLAA